MVVPEPDREREEKKEHKKKSQRERAAKGGNFLCIRLRLCLGTTTYLHKTRSRLGRLRAAWPGSHERGLGASRLWRTTSLPPPPGILHGSKAKIRYDTKGNEMNASTQMQTNTQVSAL